MRLASASHAQEFENNPNMALQPQIVLPYITIIDYQYSSQPAKDEYLLVPAKPRSQAFPVFLPCTADWKVLHQTN